MSDSRTRSVSQPYFQNRFKRVGRRLAFSGETVGQYRAWRSKTVRVLKNLIGYDTMMPARLAPRITEEVACDRYRRQRVEIQTEPGVVMPVYVLIPEGQGPFPAVMAPHGHDGGGKAAVAGRRDIPEVAAKIKAYNYDYGVQLVRAGFIVFCSDAHGFGERRELAYQDSILSSSCQYLNHMALPLGQTVTGMWAWDLHRLADYIQTRADCMAGRIACAGLSGGGLQALWATALDTRIRGAVISGYLYGVKESLLDQYWNCSCNYVPHLWEHVDMGDIAALIAPRPLLVETGSKDSLNGASGLDNVRSQMRTIRKAYRLHRAQQLLLHDVFEGEHRWNGVRAIPWLKDRLPGARR